MTHGIPEVARRSAFVAVLFAVALALVFVARPALASDDQPGVVSATVPSNGDYVIGSNGETTPEPAAISVTVPNDIGFTIEPDGTLATPSAGSFAITNLGSVEAWVSGWTVKDGEGLIGKATLEEAKAGASGSWWLGVSANTGEWRPLSISQGGDGSEGPLDESWKLPAGGSLHLATSGFFKDAPIKPGSDSTVAATVEWSFGSAAPEDQDGPNIVIEYPLARAKTFDVTYDLNMPASSGKAALKVDGKEYTSAGDAYKTKTDAGQAAVRPAADPTATDASGKALTFAGWYADSKCSQPWDFNEAVEADTTLYAKWLPGYAYAVMVDGTEMWFVRATDADAAKQRALEVSGASWVNYCYGFESDDNPAGYEAYDIEAVPTTADARAPWTTAGWGTYLTKVVFYDAVVPGTCAGWFQDMSLLEGIDGLKNLSLCACTSTAHLFEGCANLTSLDLTGWDTTRVKSMADMFSGCAALTGLKTGNGWAIEQATSGRATFPVAMKGGMGTSYAADSEIPSGAGTYSTTAQAGTTSASAQGDLTIAGAGEL